MVLVDMRDLSVGHSGNVSRIGLARSHIWVHVYTMHERILTETYSSGSPPREALLLESEGGQVNSVQ